MRKPNSCKGCPFESYPGDYVPPGGRGSRMVVLTDIPREDETEALTKGSGYLFNRVLQRTGIDRDKITVTPLLHCHVASWETHPRLHDAVDHCWRKHTRSDLLDLNPQVIVPLGKFTTSHLLGERITDVEDVRGYPMYRPSPLWVGAADGWVLPTYHPSHVLGGRYNLEPVLSFDLSKAWEIAENGHEERWGDYVLDPEPRTAMKLAKEMLHNAANPLSFDGEWDRHTRRITRFGYTTEPYKGMSLPWTPEYWPVHQLLLSSDAEKLAWNKSADLGILAENDWTVNGHVIDGMVAWHILHTDLPKGLDFVATFAAQDMPRWAHLAGERHAFYNAVDVDATLRIYLNVKAELEKLGRWHIFQRHVLDLDKRLEKMSATGMPFSEERRMAAVKKVEDALAEAQATLETLVPQSIRNFHPKEGYKRTPKDTTGCVLMRFDDDLLGKVERYVRFDEVKLSSQLILRYQELQNHRVQYKHEKGKGKRPTTDENALRKLALLYPEDPLYPHIVTMRKLKILRGTFLGKLEDGKVVGGIPVGRDGRVHTRFSHNPSTLRLASEQPNMQNLPRPTDEWAKLVKNCFVAPDGFSFEARDFSGIEAVLVGYFAKSKAYTKVALHDVHTYATAWWLYDSGDKLAYEDLPQIEMSEADLVECLAELKRRFKVERQGIKPQVHAINYLAKPKRVQEILFDELGWTLPLKDIRRFFTFYFQLFPEIEVFHSRLLTAVEGRDGAPLHGLRYGNNWIQNPFDYLHMFHQVVRWQNISGHWQWSPGPGANELAAFPAQSTAAAIGKDAILAFEADYPHLADGLRLFIHDELLGEWRAEQREEVHAALRDVMERPIKQLPLPPEWMMGEYLHINTEGKTGPVWGEMRDTP